MNYCMTKGTVPIPGAKDARQAEAVVGCLGWRLDEAEVAELEAAAAAVPSTPGRQLRSRGGDRSTTLAQSPPVPARSLARSP